jgi:endonuclease-3
MRLASISGGSDIAGGCATYFLNFLFLFGRMSVLKRTLSSPTTSPRLTSHVSHHNSAVTIFQLSSHEDDIEHSPRRSKRVKTRNNEGHLGLENLSHDVLSVKSWKTGASTIASGSALPSPSKPRDVQASPKKFKAIPQSLATPHPPPSTWKEIYDTIRDMRSRFVAPVDTMGCDMAQFKETDPKVIKGFFFNPFKSTF